ncbi:MAG: nucleotide sugar dehydrogenase [Planctomycetota bacterium]
MTPTATPQPAADAPLSPEAERLHAKIVDRSAVVAVVGLGYVGLPLARVFWDAGFSVLGLDNDPEKIAHLADGRTYLKHLGDDLVRPMTAERFEGATDPARLADADAILICLPTPLDAHLEPDLSFVDKAAEMVRRHRRPGQLVVLESSTYPGTTRERIGAVLTADGAGLGRDVFLAYSPEREDPGRADHSTRTIPKLVGGADPVSTRLTAELYRAALDEVVAVDNCEVAESAKLLENIYRAVNIALVNEMKLLLTAMGVDVWKVVDAAATKPFGFQAFYPGPGLGGHCIPIDPFYLSWKAKEHGLTTRFIELAGVVNREMPDYVVSRVQMGLNRHKKAVNGSSILVLGLAYKPNVDDVRESPSLELIEKLQALGARVDYHDPHVPATHRMRHHDLKMTSVDIDAERLAGYDGVLVATHHDAIDWPAVAEHARLIIDTRGVYRDRYGLDDRVIPA